MVRRRARGESNDPDLINVDELGRGAVTINLAWRWRGRHREGVRGSRTPGLTPHPPRLDDPGAGRALHPDTKSGRPSLQAGGDSSRTGRPLPSRGQPPDQGREHGPVRPIQAWSRVGAVEHRDLMSQDEEFDVLDGGRAALLEVVRPVSRMSPRTCWRIRYGSRKDTAARAIPLWHRPPTGLPEGPVGGLDEPAGGSSHRQRRARSRRRRTPGTRSTPIPWPGT